MLLAVASLSSAGSSDINQQQFIFSPGCFVMIFFFFLYSTNLQLYVQVISAVNQLRGLCKIKRFNNVSQSYNLIKHTSAVDTALKMTVEEITYTVNREQLQINLIHNSNILFIL